VWCSDVASRIGSLWCADVARGWAVCGVQIWQGDRQSVVCRCGDGIGSLWCADVASRIGSLWCADVARGWAVCGVQMWQGE